MAAGEDTGTLAFDWADDHRSTASAVVHNDSRNWWMGETGSDYLGTWSALAGVVPEVSAGHAVEWQCTTGSATAAKYHSGRNAAGVRNCCQSLVLSCR